MTTRTSTACTSTTPDETTALYDTTIRHVRRAPVHHAFEYRSYSWFLDVDRPPRLPRWLRPFASFRAGDHLAPAAGGDTLRARVDDVLAGHGIDLRGGRVTALMNARVLGYVFDPLTLFWCHDLDGTLVAVIAEVHNTYGGRHSYVVRVDGDGRAEVGKEFYVSPFNEVDGHYSLVLPEPGERLAVTVVLHRPGAPPFTATMRGTRVPAVPSAIVRRQVRAPLAPLAVAARIRIQGIALWVRGLKPTPRPALPDSPHREKETFR